MNQAILRQMKYKMQNIHKKIMWDNCLSPLTNESMHSFKPSRLFFSNICTLGFYKWKFGNGQRNYQQSVSNFTWTQPTTLPSSCCLGFGKSQFCTHSVFRLHYILRSISHSAGLPTHYQVWVGIVELYQNWFF